MTKGDRRGERLREAAIQREIGHRKSRIARKEETAF